MDMPARNVEIKAKVRNIEEVLLKAKQLSSSEGITLDQKDTFYHTNNPCGRLKLREEVDHSTLISYHRPNTEGPKLSQYKKCPVSDPAGLASVLEDALGVRGIVKKQRILFIVGQTRVHIDRVDGLGDFMELEVVLTEDQSPEEGQIIARQLMSQLAVSESDLLAEAYMDMLLSQTS